MKFEGYLESNRVPEWSNAYVPYGNMKKLIEQLKSSADPDTSERLTEALNASLQQITDFDRETMNTLEADFTFLENQQAPETHQEWLNMKRAYLTLHKALTFLINYRVLNKLAFHKIVKKMDKNFQLDLTNTWLTPHVSENTMFELDDILALQKKTFDDLTQRVYGGDGERAKARVRREEFTDHKSYSKEMLRIGFYTGIGVTLVIATILNLVLLNGKTLWKRTFSLLVMFGMLLLLLLLFFGIALCYHIWHRYRINFAFVMELDARSALSPKQFAEIPAFGFFTWSVAFYIALVYSSVDHLVEYVLIALLLLWTVILLFPFQTLHYYTRLWFVKQMGRILIPGHRYVTFADFFIADIMVSLTFLYVLMYVGTCYYVRRDDPAFADKDFEKECGPKRSWIPILIAGYPFFIRAVQNLRRMYDTPKAARLQFINFWKYIVGLVALVLSTLWIYFGSTKLWIAWVVFAVAYTVYATAWDIVIDWGLFGQLFHRKRARIFPPEVHFFAVVMDLLLRITWVSLLNTWLFGLGMKWGWVLAVLEVIRRSVWACLRVENEHANNVESFRAVQDIPHLYIKPPIEEDDLEQQQS